MASIDSNEKGNDVQHKEITTADENTHEMSADERLLHSLGYKQVIALYYTSIKNRKKKQSDFSHSS